MKRIQMKKSVVVGLSLFVVLLMSIFVTTLLFKITDYGISIASFGATIFMALSRDNLNKRKIFGSYIIAVVLGFVCSRMDLGTINVALAAVCSIVMMTILEFQHAPAIGISVAMVLNKFPFWTDLVVLLCILTLLSLVILLRVMIKDPHKLSRYVVIEEEKIKWNLKPRSKIFISQ